MRLTEGMEMLRVFWDEATALDAGLAQRDENQMPLCKPGELAALFRDAKLSAVSETGLVIRMQFSSFDDYWEPFRLGQGPAGAYVAALSPEPAPGPPKAPFRSQNATRSPKPPATVEPPSEPPTGA